MNRRSVLTGLTVTMVPVASRAARADPIGERLAAIEARVGGRLGVALLDLGSGHRASYRADERFRMCSTFKALLAAFILWRVDRGQERLDRRITYAAGLPDYSPVTEHHVADGMTIRDLCAAAVTVSDNGAANLLLASAGGPAALTRFLRRTGDPVTRLDRNEPALNQGAPDDPRDTSTPVAMIDSLRRLVLGTTLSPASRAQLAAWLVASTTGKARIRAGAPAGWTVGDKTGTYGSDTEGTSNDVAILWPPARPPLLIAAFLMDSPSPGPTRDAALAQATRVVLSDP